MKISTIKDLLDAKVLVCEENLNKDVASAFGCDLMSDVLAYVKDQSVLLSGLVNPQVIRTAVMMDMVCIVFVRSKTPTEEMLELAKESGIVIMTTDGVVDAFNGKEEMSDFVSKLACTNPQTFAETILSEAVRLNDMSAKDDMTVLVARTYLKN